MQRRYRFHHRNDRPAGFTQIYGLDVAVAPVAPLHPIFGFGIAEKIMKLAAVGIVTKWAVNPGGQPFMPAEAANIPAVSIRLQQGKAGAGPANRTVPGPPGLTGIECG